MHWFGVPAIAAIAIHCTEQTVSFPARSDETLASLTERYDETNADKCFQEAVPVLRDALRRGDPDDIPALVGLARVLASIGNRKHERGEPKIGLEEDRCIQALHVAWMLSPSTTPALLEGLVDEWERSPILAGAALSVLARSPRAGEHERYLELFRVAIKPRFSRPDGRDSYVVRQFEEALRTYGVSESVRDEARGIWSFENRIAYLVELAAHGNDWLDEPTFESLEERAHIAVSEWGPFDPGDGRCVAYVYCAREELRAMSEAQPTRFGRALARRLENPHLNCFSNSDDSPLDIRGVFTSRTHAVLRVRWMSPAAATAYDRAKCGW